MKIDAGSKVKTPRTWLCFQRLERFVFSGLRVTMRITRKCPAVRFPLLNTLSCFQETSSFGIQPIILISEELLPSPRSLVLPREFLLPHQPQVPTERSRTFRFQRQNPITRPLPLQHVVPGKVGSTEPLRLAGESPSAQPMGNEPGGREKWVQESDSIAGSIRLVAFRSLNVTICIIIKRAQTYT